MNEIVLTQRLKDDFKALPQSVQKKLKKQIRFLAENPKHQSLQIHRIQGTVYWEFYIDKKTEKKNQGSRAANASGEDDLHSDPLGENVCW